MPTNVTKDMIQKLVDELVECREEYGRMKTVRKDSPLAKLQISTWGGQLLRASGAGLSQLNTYWRS